MTSTSTDTVPGAPAPVNGGRTSRRITLNWVVTGIVSAAVIAFVISQNLVTAELGQSYVL